MAMFPRNTQGRNNSVTRVTVGRFGNAGIVTSQLSNEVSFAHVSNVYAKTSTKLPTTNCYNKLLQQTANNKL